MQIATESMKAAVQAMPEAAGPTKRNSVPVATTNITARSSEAAPKQPSLNWKAQDNYGTLNKIYTPLQRNNYHCCIAN